MTDGQSLYGPWAPRDIRLGMPGGAAPLDVNSKVPLQFLPPLGVGLSDPVIITAARTAAPGEYLGCDTTTGGFPVTLPADPAVGDKVVLEDPYGTWGTNNLTVTAGGVVTIDGDPELTCDVPARFTLIFAAGSWKTKENTLLFPFAV